MASNRSHVGSVIRIKRQELGLTQVELANMLGITQGTLAQYESGKRNPKVATVQRFADALGVPWPDLYEDNMEFNCALKENFRSQQDASAEYQHSCDSSMNTSFDDLSAQMPFRSDDKRNDILLDFDKLNANGRAIALHSTVTLFRNQFKGDSGRQLFIFLLQNMDSKALSTLANLLIELPYIPHLRLSEPDSSDNDS